jgi:hypothetical protein
MTVFCDKLSQIEMEYKMLKSIIKNREFILDIVRIILKNRYNYNTMTRRILSLLWVDSPLARNLLWVDSLYERAEHVSEKRESGKITITFEGDF